MYVDYDDGRRKIGLIVSRSLSHIPGEGVYHILCKDNKIQRRFANSITRLDSKTQQGDLNAKI